jgi:opacity protein-like surface antigen
MHTVLRASLAGAALFVLLSGSPANAQDATQHETPLTRQLHRIDFGLSAQGETTTNATGLNFSGITPVQTPMQLSVQPSNTVGVLTTLRYTRSRWVGFEGNFGYARYTEAFSAFVVPQTNADEYTLGYVVHPGKLFGLDTFVSGGSGSIAFRPTTGGGLNLPKQARQVYYYSAGVETPILGSSFGFRVAFRQGIYLAPDFEENYLRIKKRVLTTEPTIGFTYHF